MPLLPRDSDYYTSAAVRALLDASERESDFSGWLSSVVTAAARMRGGWEVLERRPGSWEASLVERLVLPGDDDQGDDQTGMTSM